MKRVLFYLLPVLFLASACGQGNKGNDENSQTSKDTTKQMQSEKDKKDEENEVNLRFPIPSPHGWVKQIIGINKVKIDYYRPSVSDPETGEKRKIWGDLVPYGEMWRTGANANTTIKFSHDVALNGNDVEAGKYSLFTIPEKDEWTIVLNNKTDHSGTMGYDKSNDALRFKVKPESAPYHEMMTFDIKEVTDTSGVVELAWKETAIAFNVKTNTENQVQAMMDKAIDQAGKDDWKTYYQCANYLVEKGKMMDKAEKWLNKSIEAKENWRNLWAKAELMDEKGNIKDAVKLAEKSLEVGKKNDMSSGYQDYMKGNIEELKKKMDN